MVKSSVFPVFLVLPSRCVRPLKSAARFVHKSAPLAPLMQAPLIMAYQPLPWLPWLITINYHDASMVWYANIKGVYWWDPWHTIYSSTMDPSWGLNWTKISFLASINHNQPSLNRASGVRTHHQRLSTSPGWGKSATSTCLANVFLWCFDHHGNQGSHGWE